MSDDYDVGYGKPSPACYYPKGQSGNPRGKKRKPPATLAQTIEKLWMEPFVYGEGEGQTKVIPFEVIVINLIAEIGEVNEKAYHVFRRYEAFAGTMPALKKYTAMRPEEAAERYKLFCAGAPDWKTRKLNLPPLSPQEQQRSAREARIERMKAGLEEPIIDPDMSHEEAAVVYDLSRKQPSPPPPKPHRRSNGKSNLEASEVFERTIKAPVTVREEARSRPPPAWRERPRNC
jgi:hypothetical protein